MSNHTETRTKTVIKPRWSAVTWIAGAAAALSFVIGVNMANTPGNVMHETKGQPTIERCVNDDYNDGSQDLCWTERSTDGAYLVINRDDKVVSVRAE